MTWFPVMVPLNHSQYSGYNHSSKRFLRELSTSNTFDVFNTQNLIKEATRITPSTETLIDVIATNKPELVRTTGVLPLGITDHSLVYATLRLKRKRPPPTVITVRNFKQFNTENLKQTWNKHPSTLHQ